MAKMKLLDWTAIALLIVGGLNWGLAIWDINLITALLGTIPYAVKIVYGLVGLSAIYSVYSLFIK